MANIYGDEKSSQSGRGITGWYHQAANMLRDAAVLVHVSFQNQKGRKSLEVKKNRFDGDLGEVQLAFDPASSKLREYT